MTHYPDKSNGNGPVTILEFLNAKLSRHKDSKHIWEKKLLEEPNNDIFQLEAYYQKCITKMLKDEREEFRHRSQNKITFTDINLIEGIVDD
jgi:hypothetical protein